MSNSYIGVNNVARKITGGYIGVNNVARKITKAYVGDENGKAKLIYTATAPQTIITFTDVIAPSTWDEVTLGTKYTATNTYGTWEISASGYTSSNYVSKAFDIVSSTNWRKTDMTADEYAWVQQLFPIPINPKTIKIRNTRTNRAKVQLLQMDGTWLDVQNMSTTGGVTWTEINCNYDQYFKGMRVYGLRSSETYKYFSIYEFYVEKGSAIV